MSVKSETVQDKIARLNEILGWFDGDDFSVEEAMSKFKQAEVLAEEIEKDLKSLKNEVSIVKKKFDTKG